MREGKRKRVDRLIKIRTKSEVRERRERINFLIKSSSKREMSDGGREEVNILIEVIAESEMSDKKKKKEREEDDYNQNPCEDEGGKVIGRLKS